MSFSTTIPGLSLFSGVGGFELGLEPYGHRSVFFCEKEPAARAVLRAWKPRVPIAEDIQLLDELPREGVLLTAGFPCSDISKAGRKLGIFGAQSGLVRDVFRLLEKRPVAHVILENVPDLLSLGGGIGIQYITSELARLGYRWAYRVVDSWYFGVPQRRRRIFLVASRTADPREILLADDQPMTPAVRGRSVDLTQHAVGFYPSEGSTGYGLALDGIPPLKASATIPAVLFPNGMVGTPDLRDAERLQALPEGWTEAGAIAGARGRWKLVGNAVTKSVPQWIASRMALPAIYDGAADPVFTPGRDARWPAAAWSMGDDIRVSPAGENPCGMRRPNIAEWLKYPVTPVSARSVAGFLHRASMSRLQFPTQFLDRLRAHHERMRATAA